MKSVICTLFFALAVFLDYIGNYNINNMTFIILSKYIFSCSQEQKTDWKI